MVKMILDADPRPAASLVCENQDGSPKCKWYGRETRRKYDSNMVHTLRFCRCPALMRTVMLNDIDILECTLFDRVVDAC